MAVNYRFAFILFILNDFVLKSAVAFPNLLKSHHRFLDWGQIALIIFSVLELSCHLLFLNLKQKQVCNLSSECFFHPIFIWVNQAI
jgi:hypothetical protein